MRAGAAILQNRRVQLDIPTRAERALAAGTQLPSVLYDLPSADYQMGDIVTVVSLDGQTSAPHPGAFLVGTVDFLPAPLALTSVELGVSYNPQTA